MKKLFHRKIVVCFFMCALLNRSSLLSADNSVLLHLISTQKLFVSPCLCAWDNLLCMFPRPQGPSCCHKETLHQRPDCVRSVAPVCVGMERICRCHGESWITPLLHCAVLQYLRMNVLCYVVSHRCLINLLFSCVCQNGPSLLVLMGIRFEGLIPAIILPLLLTMVRNSNITTGLVMHVNR